VKPLVSPFDNARGHSASQVPRGEVYSDRRAPDFTSSLVNPWTVHALGHATFSYTDANSQIHKSVASTGTFQVQLKEHGKLIQDRRETVPDEVVSEALVADDTLSGAVPRDQTSGRWPHRRFLQEVKSMSLAFQVLKFDISKQSQAKEWSDSKEVKFSHKIRKDEYDKQVVDVALKSFDLGYAEDRDHFVEYIYLLGVIG
jgi:hypothetical protein